MDDEVKGEGNSINYKFRMHDPRVGRFFAVDPLTYKYPWYSPYQFSGNKVIQFIELEGKEEFRNLGEFDPYAEGMALDQIWDRAVDGAGNLMIGLFTLRMDDETEGLLIYRFMTEKLKVNVPEGVSAMQLGQNFNFKKRNRSITVEPDKGILSELLDYTVSTVDVVGIYLGKNGVFMAVRSSPITGGAISKVLRSLKINARTKEILDDVNFKDLATGKAIRDFEAEGIAIFEETFQTTARAINNLDSKAGDFIVTSGKYANKSVDLVTAAGGSNFKLEDFIKSVDRHYLKDGVDLVNIDIRKLGDEAKKMIKDHVSKMSEARQAKTVITE